MNKSTGHVSVVYFVSGEELLEKIPPRLTLLHGSLMEALKLLLKQTSLGGDRRSNYYTSHRSNIVKARERFKMILTVIESGIEE